jgi:hypothetical protein
MSNTEECEEFTARDWVERASPVEVGTNIDHVLNDGSVYSGTTGTLHVEKVSRRPSDQVYVVEGTFHGFRSIAEHQNRLLHAYETSQPELRHHDVRSSPGESWRPYIPAGAPGLGKKR